MFEKGNRTWLAKGLMLISLGALALFLGYWLFKAYEQEKEGLEKELTYVFKDVIGEIEDSLVHKVLMANIKFENRDTFVNDSHIAKKAFGADTIALRVDIEGRAVKKRAFKTEHNRQVIIQHSGDEMPSLEGGLLPLLLHWESEKGTAMMHGDTFNASIVEMITKGYDEKAPAKKLPVDYEVLVVQDSQESPDISIPFYSVPGDGQAYAAFFGEYQWMAIRRMTSNILFALLLYAGITLSFYLIFQNWKKEQHLVTIKNEFISNVTHELKTPISTVSVALEALSNFEVLNDRQKTREYLQISKKELNRLRILVDKVLKMSIFEKGASTLNTEQVNFGRVVQDVLESMKIQFEKFGAKVHQKIDPVDLSLYGDKVHLTNVVYNILDNALKYGGPTPQVHVRLEEKGEMIVLTIRDEGKGMAKKDQAKIFQRFYRIRENNIHDIKGHGLGLSYVKSVIDQHQGRIEVESALGEGSTFTINLPKNRPHG